MSQLLDEIEQQKHLANQLLKKDIQSVQNIPGLVKYRLDTKLVDCNDFTLYFLEGRVSICVSLIFHDRQTGHDLVIRQINVLPDEYWNQGYGSMILQRLKEWAKRENFDSMRATQVQASKFFEKNGFQSIEGSKTNDYLCIL